MDGCIRWVCCIFTWPHNLGNANENRNAAINQQSTHITRMPITCSMCNSNAIVPADGASWAPAAACTSSCTSASSSAESMFCGARARLDVSIAVFHSSADGNVGKCANKCTANGKHDVGASLYNTCDEAFDAELAVCARSLYLRTTVRSSTMSVFRVNLHSGMAGTQASANIRSTRASYVRGSTTKRKHWYSNESHGQDSDVQVLH